MIQVFLRRQSQSLSCMEHSEVVSSIGHQLPHHSALCTDQTVSLKYDLHILTSIRCLFIRLVLASGKTWLIVAMISFLCRVLDVVDPKSSIRILIAAITNVAVDNILLGLLNSGFANFARVGSLRSINKKLLKHVIHHTDTTKTIQEQNEQAIAEMKRWRNELQSKSAPPQQSQKQQPRFNSFSPSSSASSSSSSFSSSASSSSSSSSINDSDPVSSELSNLDSAISHLESCNFQRENRRLRDMRVIGTTCAATNFSIFSTSRFAICFQDEASQMIEPAALLPLTFGCERTVMVGDPKQLEPILEEGNEIKTMITAGSVSPLLKTAFLRLAEGGFPAILLRTQYRSHPILTQISNRIFYDNQLIDGVTEEQRAPLLREGLTNQSASVPTLAFIHVIGQETKGSAQQGGWGWKAGRDVKATDESHSLINESEIEMVVRLVFELLSKGIAPDRIGVISFYRAHVNALRRRVASIETNASYYTLVDDNDSIQTHNHNADQRENSGGSKGGSGKDRRTQNKSRAGSGKGSGSGSGRGSGSGGSSGGSGGSGTKSSKRNRDALIDDNDDGMKPRKSRRRSLFIDDENVDDDSTANALTSTTSTESLASSGSIPSPSLPLCRQIRRVVSGSGVQVSTVDAFQGGEKDIIILSTVRSGGARGFIDNPNRSNVALTRARNHLFIVGNAETLKKDEAIWKHVVQLSQQTPHSYYAQPQTFIQKLQRSSSVQHLQYQQAPNRVINLEKVNAEAKVTGTQEEMDWFEGESGRQMNERELRSVSASAVSRSPFNTVRSSPVSSSSSTHSFTASSSSSSRSLLSSFVPTDPDDVYSRLLNADDAAFDELLANMPDDQLGLVSEPNEQVESLENFTVNEEHKFVDEDDVPLVQISSRRYNQPAASHSTSASASASSSILSSSASTFLPAHVSPNSLPNDPQSVNTEIIAINSGDSDEKNCSSIDEMIAADRQDVIRNEQSVGVDMADKIDQGTEGEAEL